MNKKVKLVLTLLSIVILGLVLTSAVSVQAAPFKDTVNPKDANVIFVSKTGELINPILLWVFGIIGIICVVMIVIGGVGIATSADNEEKRKKNIKTVTWALIGLVIILIAYSLVAIVGTGVTEPFTKSNPPK